jgi:hypothetical protein
MEVVSSQIFLECKSEDKENSVSSLSKTFVIQLVIQDNSAGIINHSSDCTPTVSVQHTITSLKYIKRTGEKDHLRIF